MEKYGGDWAYIRRDGTPRNYTAPDIDLEMGEEAIQEAWTRADVEAFKSTQRWMALGITAVGGALANAFNPPNTVGDFVGNLSVPAAIQGLNYITFRKGVGLMRRRDGERRSHS